MPINPTTIAGAAAVFFAALAATFVYLYQGEVNDFADYRAKEDAQQELIRIDNERQEREQVRIAKDTADGWAAALSVLNGPRRVVRVLRPDCNQGAGQALSAAGLKFDAGTAQPGLGATVDVAAAACEERLNRAVADAAQVEWLKDFIVRTHEASN